MTESGRALAIEKDGLVWFPRNNFGVALTISEHHESRSIFTYAKTGDPDTNYTIFSFSKCTGAIVRRVAHDQWCFYCMMQLKV